MPAVKYGEHVGATVLKSTQNEFESVKIAPTRRATRTRSEGDGQDATWRAVPSQTLGCGMAMMRG